MTQSLVDYIESDIIPRYAAFDKAHREDHVRTVIERALAMGKSYDIDENMLYVAAACHDLGLAVDRKTHHLESGKIIRADDRLREWFSAGQIETKPRRPRTTGLPQSGRHVVSMARWLPRPTG